jgi:flagellar hook-basal body complex protein FliE
MISNIESTKQYLPKLRNISEEEPKETRTNNFTDTLGEFVRDVNALQKESGDMTEKMLKGEPVDIHDVMIASEKAKTSFQLLVEMRNKFVDMYHEILRMQV